jgi:hypothetical protein
MKETARAPTKAERRDYAAFAQRVGSLRERGWDVRQRGEICGLPFFVAERGLSGTASVPQVLVVGGHPWQRTGQREGTCRERRSAPPDKGRPAFRYGSAQRSVCEGV